MRLESVWKAAGQERVVASVGGWSVGVTPKNCPKLTIHLCITRLERSYRKNMEVACKQSWQTCSRKSCALSTVDMPLTIIRACMHSTAWICWWEMLVRSIASNLSWHIAQIRRSRHLVRNSCLSLLDFVLNMFISLAFTPWSCLPWTIPRATTNPMALTTVSWQQSR